MRRPLLLALLAVLALAWWSLNLVRWEPVPDPHEGASPADDPPRAPGEAETPVLRGPQALSLERHPERVADDAGILGNYLPTLTWQTAAWAEDLGIEFHVATLADATLPIDALAAEVMTLRRIGQGAPTGGILLILDPVRRDARIEVSYALEGAFPDAVVSRIARDQLAPYAAHGAVGMATMDVLHMLKDLAVQQSLAGPLALDAGYREQDAYVERARFLSGGAGARVVLPTLEELASRDFKARVPERARARYAPSPDPLESVEALLRVKRDLVGDPSLPLFTPGSRCMKRRYPFAPYEQAERAARLEASRPWQVVTRDDRAVVSGGRRVHGAVPVLLRRIDGTWRVDLVETWKNLFFDENGDYRLRNGNTPYAFGLGAHGDASHFEDLRPWDLAGVPLETVIERLERADGALYDFLLGEVLFRNCFLPDEALAHYGAAADAARSPLFGETLGDRARYMGFHDMAVRAYARLGRWGQAELAEALAARGDPARAAEIGRDVVNENPYDPTALRTLHGHLQRAGREEEAAEIAGRIAALASDDRGRQQPLAIAFDPPDPVYDIEESTQVGDVEVFDHAYFTLTLTNPTRRPVEVEQVKVRTVGYGPGRSGLGDIRSYFEWPEPHRLEPGQSVQVSRTWGFTVDTPHDQLSYVVEVCWRGEGEPHQCRHRRLDLMPR